MYQSAARTHVHVHVQDVHRQCKWLLNSALRADLHLLRHHISTSIVNLGTGYETLGISKAGTIQSLAILICLTTPKNTWLSAAFPYI